MTNVFLGLIYSRYKTRIFTLNVEGNILNALTMVNLALSVTSRYIQWGRLAGLHPTISSNLLML